MQRSVNCRALCAQKMLCPPLRQPCCDSAWSGLHAQRPSFCSPIPGFIPSHSPFGLFGALTFLAISSLLLITAKPCAQQRPCPWVVGAGVGAGLPSLLARFVFAGGSIFRNLTPSPGLDMDHTPPSLPAFCDAQILSSKRKRLLQVLTWGCGGAGEPGGVLSKGMGVGAPGGALGLIEGGPALCCPESPVRGGGAPGHGR